MAGRKPLLAVAVIAFCLASLHSGRARTANAVGDAEGRVLQNAANEFFIGFAKNAGTPTALQLFVTTTEPNPVNFFVETLTGVNLTGTATHTSTATVSLPSSIQVSSTTERNKGIHIQADGGKQIVVYGLSYHTHSSDAFLALPCHCLDLEEYEYYAVTYDGVSHPGYPTTILVVGCEDNTTITTKFGTVTLNKQETYYIEDNGDLTGARIVANEPISVFSGHTCTNVPSGVGACDHLTEQVPPTASWGRFFLVASLLGRRGGEIYRIIAAHDSTEVTINCNTLAQPVTLALSNAGNWQEIQLNADSFCAFESNNPILIMQFALGRESDGVGDPFMTMVPAVEQYSNNYVVSVLEQFGANYITVAVAPRYFQPEQIFVDGSNLANANWSTAYCFDGSICGNITRMPVQPGEHQLYHEDTNAKLGITVYGFNRDNSYGYIGGLQLAPQFECVPSCENGNCTGPDRCTCIPGWTGPTCGRDDNECTRERGGCDQICNNTVRSYFCSCNDGFQLLDDQRSCEDIPECDTNNGDCHQNCIELPGSFMCSCDEGYEFQEELERSEEPSDGPNTNAGRMCTDVNECLIANGRCDQNCNNIEGSFYCSCNGGYELVGDGFHCIDIDDCERGTHNCTGIAQCRNGIGYFTCTCPVGYEVNTTDYASCSDIDECTQGISGCSQICTNTIGSYECSCNGGYALQDDERTCIDVDECEVDDGGCERHCINTQGSYHCACDTGFTLESDGRRCRPLTCPTLNPPQNGTISCPRGYITGGVCTFSCDTGYILTGSQLRICHPSTTWSGNPVICEPFLCQPLEPPSNGVILVPCNREYTSVCTIQCVHGYTIDGPPQQTCILNDQEDGARWTEQPTCNEINTCDPNPCLHNGSCIEDNVDIFTCNCEGTGYKGPTCNIGILITPAIPNLLVNQLSPLLSISGVPDQEIIVTVSVDRSDGLEINTSTPDAPSPAGDSSLLLTSKQMTAEFRIRGKRPGFFTISYHLSGPSANSFEPPQDTCLLVNRPRTGPRLKYFIAVAIQRGQLRESCCVPDSPLYMCPMSTDGISFQSTCMWIKDGQTYSTTGIVFTKYRELSIPLSIAGTKVTISSASLTNVLPDIPISNCTPCAANVDRNVTLIDIPSAPFPPENENCYFYRFDTPDLEDFLFTQSLSLTYIDHIHSLLPPWMTIRILGRLQNVATECSEYTATLVQPEIIQTIKGCENIQMGNPGLYSILQYNQFLLATIDRDFIAYSPDTSGIPICFGVNLCEGSLSPVYIGLSPPAQSLMNSLSFLLQYLSRGWNFTITSVTLFKSLKQINLQDRYWNGVRLQHPDLPAFDLLMNTDASLSFSSGNLHANLNHAGLVHYLFNDAQERNGVLEGDTNVLITTTIEGSSEGLHLSSFKPVVAFTTDQENHLCQHLRENEDARQSGISLKVSYRPQHGQEFFSRLFSLVEETVECPGDVFMNLDSNLELRGISLRTGCPRLRLGMLILSGMTHTLYFPGANELCVMETDFNQENASLLVQSSLNRGRLPLGYFMTLLPGNLVSLSAAFRPESSSFKARMHSVNMSILDAHFNIPVDIQNGELRASTETEIFNSYASRLNISAPISRPWNRLSLSVYGEMLSNPDGFQQRAQQYIRDLINSTATRAQRRQMEADMTVSRACEVLQNLQEEYRAREEALLEANLTYQNALEQLEVANQTLISAEGAFDDADEELRQAQQNVNTICRVESCEDAEVCEQVCATCNDYQVELEENAGTCTRYARRNESRTVIVSYRTEQQYELRTICNYECNSRCYLFCERRCENRCRGMYVPVTRRYPVYERVQGFFVVREQVRCPGLVCRNNVSSPCPCEEVCNLQPNVTCRQTCQNQQALAIDSLRRTQQNIAAPFQTLDSARRNFTLAQIEVSRARAQRENAQQMLNQVLQPYQSAQTAKELSEQSRQDVQIEIQNGLRVAELLDEHESPDNIFQISSISFNITLATQSPTQFPLLFTCEVPAREETFRKSIVYDFSAPIELGLRRVGEEILGSVFNVTLVRRRRFVERRQVHKRQAPESEIDPNVEEFQRRCVHLQNLHQYFTDFANSLQELNDRIQAAKQSISMYISTLTSEFDPIEHQSLVNYDALESLFNISPDEADITELLENDEAIDAYINQLEEMMQSASNLSETVGSTSFSEWQATMEVLHNITRSVSGRSCNNFVDCLGTAVEILRELLEDIPDREADELLEQLPHIEEELLELGTAMNLSIPDAMARIGRIVDVLNADVLTTYWCSSPPIITLEPPPEINIVLGDDLVVNCSAESQLPVIYHWRKEGNPIPNTESSTLVIENMQRLDSGNYTCHASNPVGMARSMNASVFVYELPIFYLEPASLAVYAGDESGALLTCNATAWPYPGWRWYFRPNEGSQRTLIEGEDTNELLIPNPQKENEGLYTCEAFNNFGRLRSQSAYLTILPVTVSQLTLSLQFEITTQANTGDCTNAETLEDAIFLALSDQIDFGSTSIHTIEVENVTNSAQQSSYIVRLTLASQNVTDEITPSSTLQEIGNIALPSRGDLVRVRDSLQTAVDEGQLMLTCGGFQYQVLSSSLTFYTPSYLCPPGQELHSTYLICVGCPPGTFQTVTQRVRVFNGEGITERLPVCDRCPTGFYEDQVGSTECQPCPEFYRTNITGSTSIDNCFVDPLLLNCDAGGTPRLVEIDCRTNRPPNTVTCSFDDGLEHPCELPIVITLQAFESGNHILRVTVTDRLGFTAEQNISYVLESDTRTNFLPSVPPLGIHLIDDSPRIDRNSIEADFTLTRPATTVICEISRFQVKECSSGTVVFSDLNPGTHTLRIVASNSREDRAFLRRRFEITSDPSLCILHLINDGVTVEDDQAIVEFAGTGPAVSFTCKLDNSPSFTCTTPVVLSDLQAGDHTLRIIPSGCGRNRRPLRVDFQV